MPSDLTKSEKKIARQIIEKGLMKEFHQGILNMEAIISEWRKNKGDNRETYHKLYKTLTDYDEYISRRYDRMTGSRYILIIAQQLADQIISIDDLKGLKEETIHQLMIMVGHEG